MGTVVRSVAQQRIAYVEKVLRHRPLLYDTLTMEERCHRSDPSLAFLGAARAMATGNTLYGEIPEEVRDSGIPHAAFMLASIGCSYDPGYEGQVTDYQLLPRSLREGRHAPTKELMQALKATPLGVVIRETTQDEIDNAQFLPNSPEWKRTYWMPCPCCNPGRQHESPETVDIRATAGCDRCSAYRQMHIGVREAIEWDEDDGAWDVVQAFAIVFVYPPLLPYCNGRWYDHEDYDEDASTACAKLYMKVPRDVIEAIDARTKCEFTGATMNWIWWSDLDEAFKHIPDSSPVRRNIEFYIEVANTHKFAGIRVTPVEFQRDPRVLKSALTYVTDIRELVRVVAAFHEGAWPPRRPDGGLYNWKQGMDMSSIVCDVHVHLFLQDTWKEPHLLDELVVFLRRIHASDPVLLSYLNTVARPLVLEAANHFTASRIREYAAAENAAAVVM